MMMKLVRCMVDVEQTSNPCQSLCISAFDGCYGRRLDVFALKLFSIRIGAKWAQIEFCLLLFVDLHKYFVILTSSNLLFARK